MESLENEAIRIAAKQAVEYMNQITKSPIGQLSEVFGDMVRVWRYKRAIKLLADVEEYHKQNGIKVKQLPIKVLLPILENATLEEDEGLQKKWTALLANATDSANTLELHNIFVELLRQLSHLEVKVLDFMYTNSQPNKDGTSPQATFSSKILREIYHKNEFQKDGSLNNTTHENPIIEKEKLIIDNLTRLNLIEITITGKLIHTNSGSSLMRSLSGMTVIPFPDKSKINLTELGAKFIQECTFKNS